MKSSVQRELPFDAAESRAPSMCGNSMRENRETHAAPPPNGGEGRSGKRTALGERHLLASCVVFLPREFFAMILPVRRSIISLFPSQTVSRESDNGDWLKAPG